VYEDQDYLSWLEIHHSEALPADRYSLVPNEKECELSPARQDPADMSLITHFQDVSPFTPLASEVDHTSSGSAGSATLIFELIHFHDFI